MANSVVVAAPASFSPVQQPARTAQGTVMSEATRLLAAFAGFGAALLTFGISSNLVYASSGFSLVTYPSAVLAGLWALGLVAWSIMTMRRGVVLWVKPMVSLLSFTSLVLLGSLVHEVWISTSESSEFDATVAGALALQLIMLAAIGYLRRLGPRPASGSLPAAKLLLALAAAATLVSAITVPGLAATTAGDFAVPHGSHGVPSEGPPVDTAELDKLEHAGH
ncbi:hypothetical protein [Arthrobacter monumenti]